MRFFASILFAAAAWSQGTNPADPAATRPFQAYVTEAQGKVSIDRDNQPWAVAPGGTVSVQQVITTGGDGFARLEVRGGAYFEVYANAHVIFRRNPGNVGDLLDVLSGRVKIHLSPGPGESQQRVYCRSAIVTAREAATIGVAVDEDNSVRIDVLEGQVAVQHALLPRSAPTIVKAIDAIVVEKDEQISRQIERGTLYRYTLKPLHDLFEVLTSGRAARVQEQPFASEFVVASTIPRNLERLRQ
jgi:hypothetical protein